MSDVKSYSYNNVKSASLVPIECLVKGHKDESGQHTAAFSFTVSRPNGCDCVFDIDLVTPGISGAISESAIYNSAVITKPQTGTKFQQI